MDFIFISKYAWLEAMVEETKQFSLCYRSIWLRAVLSVNWPEKAGLFSMQFGGTQMLPMFPNGQMGTCPGKTQHFSNVMDLGKETRVPFKEQL